MFRSRVPALASACQVVHPLGVAMGALVEIGVPARRQQPRARASRRRAACCPCPNPPALPPASRPQLPPHLPFQPPVLSLPLPPARAPARLARPVSLAVNVINFEASLHDRVRRWPAETPPCGNTFPLHSSGLIAAADCGVHYFGAQWFVPHLRNACCSSIYVHGPWLLWCGEEPGARMIQMRTRLRCHSDCTQATR